MFKKLNKKGIALLISAVLILSVAVGTTIAFLVDSTEDVTDNFTPAKVICDVTNSGDTWSVKNVENIDAYIRVAVIVNETNGTNLKWSGNPINADVLITTDATWTKVGNYYYYNGEVAPDTSVTFGQITAANAKIQVLAEAIQSTPDDAVQTAWGVTFNGTAWGS